ncbi:hypothetical protein [Glycomyces sp. NPDC048151]|uniref:hypothetical protein n=1 Tax=Glycomyces sp. NPDC048151 TaxID=3364002 RepID=UPI003716F4E6
METIALFFADVLFGEATKAARRRRAAAFAASYGLRFHSEGRSSDPDASGWFDELEMLGVPFVQPVVDTFAGPYQGRHVIGFENMLWSKDKRRNVPYRFTAVRLVRAVPDMLVAEAALPWFGPGALGLPMPVPRSAGRKVTAVDPAAADAVLAALSSEGPLERSWMARANWVVTWHRGRLRMRGGDDAASALRFLSAAADACERG